MEVFWIICTVQWSSCRGWWFELDGADTNWDTVWQTVNSDKSKGSMVPTLLPCHPTLTSPLKSKNQTESYNNSCHEPFVQNHYKTTKPFLASSSSWSQSLPDSSLELSSSSDPANTCRSCRQTWQQLHSWVSTHVECPHIHKCRVSTHVKCPHIHTCGVSTHPHM